MVLETPEEREEKRRNLKKLISKVFLALFLYIVAWNVLSTAVYVAAQLMLSPEEYQAFSGSYAVALVTSSVSQYLIAFPIFLITLIGTPKVQDRERQKLSTKEFLLTFLACETLMYLGNILGNLINNVFGTISGNVPENDVNAIISNVPAWLTFLFAVVIAPIFEELIFRKLMTDRLSIYGDHMAILFTAVAFGIIHMNLYQFFYATMLGVALGYVYTRTRDVRYTILLHMMVNFMGSVAILPFEESIYKFYELTNAFASGASVDLAELLYHGAMSALYDSIQIGMVIGGAIVLFNYIKKKKIHINRDKELYLPDGDVIKYGLKNVGTILFIAISFILTLANMLPK